MSNGLGNDSSQLHVWILVSLRMRWPHHGVRLTTPCLTVCEDGSVVALNNILHQVEGTVVVHLRLQGVLSKNHVEKEVSGWIVTVRFLKRNLADIRNVLDDSRGAPVELFLIHGPGSDHDLYRFRILCFGHVFLLFITFYWACVCFEMSWIGWDAYW